MLRVYLVACCLVVVLQVSVGAVHSTPLGGPRSFAVAYGPHREPSTHPQRSSLSFLGASHAGQTPALAPLTSSRLRQGPVQALSTAEPSPEDDSSDDKGEQEHPSPQQPARDRGAKGKATRPPIKTRFATRLTLIPVPMDADYIDSHVKEQNIADSNVVYGNDEMYRDAIWLDATKVGAAYYAPTARAELKLQSVYSGLAKLRAREGGDFRWPMTVKEDNLRLPGVKKPLIDEFADQDDGYETQEIRVPGNHRTESSSVTPPQEKGYETMEHFAGRIGLLLARILGREALEATLARSVYEVRQMNHNVKTGEKASSPPSEEQQGKKTLRIPDVIYHDGMYLATGGHRIESELTDVSERRPPVIPLVHESSVVIVADEPVLQMLIRLLLQMAHWRRNDIGRLIDQRNEARKPGQPTYRQPVQFSVNHVDELPLRNGRLFREKLRKDRQPLDVTLVTWPFS